MFFWGVRGVGSESDVSGAPLRHAESGMRHEEDATCKASSVRKRRHQAVHVGRARLADLDRLGHSRNFLQWPTLALFCHCILFSQRPLRTRMRTFCIDLRALSDWGMSGLALKLWAKPSLPYATGFERDRKRMRYGMSTMPAITESRVITVTMMISG